jgi:major membrane immunogen (membrane-anchored lipoprotein)
MSTKAILILIALFTLQTYYHDGIYTGKSQAQYTSEPYVGKADIVIENGKITKVDFTITDTAKKVLFDGKYEKYFAGNALYVQQCRNDWSGVQNYPAKLLKTQNIDKVDAVTGATWSYHIFKASVKKALLNATK